MKIFFVGLLAFCGGFFSSWGACHPATPNAAAGDMVDSMMDSGLVEVSSCDDFFGKFVNLAQDINVTAPILCTPSKIINILDGYSIVISAKHDIVFFGVHFLVEPDAQLTFVAGGDVTLQRNSTTLGDMPAVYVRGKLAIFAGGVTPGEAMLEESLVKPDSILQGLLTLHEDGRVYSGQEVTFTSDAIIVAADSSHAQSPQLSEQDDESEPVENQNTDIIDAKIKTDTLTEGQVLREGSLTSSDGTSKVWASTHGSVLFAEAKDGQEDGQVSTLIPAHGANVKAVLNTRSLLAKEAADGGGERGRAWTPWGVVQHRRMATAVQHAGEVAMSVNDRGCLKVTVDGFCVLARSGPRAWEFLNTFPCRRRRSPGYEVRAVKDGLEVTRDDEKIWGVQAPKTGDKKQGGKSGERSFFGVTAADIM